MEQVTANSDLPILKANLPTFDLEEFDNSKVTIEQILESGEKIFNEIQKLTGKQDASGQAPQGTTSSGAGTGGQEAFKLPDQAKSAFSTVASYVGWGGAAVATALLIRKIVK